MNNTEKSLNGMYGYLFSQQQPNKSTYQPKHRVQHQQQRQHDNMSVKSSATSHTNLKSKFENRALSSNGMRTYLPEQYFKQVGYQPLTDDAYSGQVVTGKMRVDALGQRVRERFNEEVNYDDKVSTASKASRHIKLNRKIGDDQTSNASSFRVRSITASSRQRAQSQQMFAIKQHQRQVKEPQADQVSIKEATAVIKKVLGDEEYEEVAESVAVEEPTTQELYPQQASQEQPEEQLMQEAAQDDAVSRPSIRSTATSQKSYLAKLERALREERDKRSKLEQEVQEVHKMNKEIAQQMGMSPAK